MCAAVPPVGDEPAQRVRPGCLKLLAMIRSRGVGAVDLLDPEQSMLHKGKLSKVEPVEHYGEHHSVIGTPLLEYLPFGLTGVIIEHTVRFVSPVNVMHR